MAKSKRKKRAPRVLSPEEIAAREVAFVQAYRGRRRGPIKDEDRALRAEELVRVKQLFLEEYTRTGRVDLATKHINVRYQSPYDWARVDEDFKKAWDQAKEVAAQGLEDAAYRRARTGVLEPVYQKGMLVGMVRRYSDTLTMFLLRGLKPAVYRDRLEHSGDPKSPVQHKVAVGLSDEVAQMMRQKVLGVSAEEKKP